MPLHNPETGARYITAKTVKRTYSNTEVLFHISVLPEDVRIHAITVCGRDIFNIVDPEIRRAAYEEFKNDYISHAI